jgi:Neuraminidase (sialidase)
MTKRGIYVVLILGVFFLTQNLESSWTLKRLTWNSGYSSNPAIVTDSNNYIHVVWDDNTPGNNEIFYKQSTDGGANWSAPKRLSWTAGTSSVPVIAVDSNNHIHVVWSDSIVVWSEENPGNGEIFYKKSTDGGANWSTKRLTWTSGSSSSPAIDLDSNNHIHIIFFDDTPGNLEIFHKKSTDGGTNWSAPKRLTWNTGNSYSPTIAVDSNNHIHAAWMDETPGNFEIFYKQSTDGGANWSAPKRLTWNTSSSGSPAIAFDSNNYIHVVLQNDTYVEAEIFYKRSTDGGANWSTKRLTWNSGSSTSPDITIDSNNHIHVVWDDSTPAVYQGNYEIFYKQSTDGGTNWSAPKRLTWNLGPGWNPSWDPAIAQDNNNSIHVVWEDFSPGNWEILYKKKD